MFRRLSDRLGQKRTWALAQKVLIRVMGHLAQVDGGLPEADFRRLFGSGLYGKGKDFRAGTQEDFDLDATLDLAQPLVEQHEMLIRSWCWFACGAGDGVLTPEKRRILEHCCDRFAMPRTLVDAVCAKCMEDAAERNTGGDSRPKKTTLAMRGIILMVMGHISTVDGRAFDKSIVRELGSAGGSPRDDEKYFRAGMAADFDLDAALAGMMPIVEAQRGMIRIWCTYACIDGKLSPEKRQILERCCDRFEVPRAFMHKICDECMED